MMWNQKKIFTFFDLENQEGEMWLLLEAAMSQVPNSWTHKPIVGVNASDVALESDHRRWAQLLIFFLSFEGICVKYL